MGASLRRRALRLPASLGAKLVLILTGVGVIGAIAITLLLAVIITPSFDRLEADAVDAHVERTRAALDEYASKVEATVRDYGDWSASYDYMGAPNAAFEQDSFATSAMVNLGINGMAYLRNDGDVVIARWLDLSRETDDAAARAAMLAAIDRIDLAAALEGGSSASFYARLGDRIAAIGVAQVRRSDGTGNPRGHVVMARLITSEQLRTLLQLDAALDVANRVSAPVIAAGPSRIRVAVPISGADDRPVASATYAVPRDLSLLGRRMLLLAVGGSTLLLMIVLVVLRRTIISLVLKPLGRVEGHMQQVRKSGAMLPLTDERRDDEIGSLVASFNAMLRQLKDLREQLEVQSFKLGRSETAVAVMHNVRNALNPVSTILSQGLALPPPVDRALLDRAVAELARDDLPPVRRQKLAAFVAAAAEAEGADRADRRRQLEIGREAMRHVLEIIGRQQEDAHERPQLAACDVTDIIAQNATIARYSGSHSIAFSFPSQPHWVMANRVILSQVVGNLFSNAAEAIAAAGRDGGTITVTIDDHDGRTRIRITDDGEGFETAQTPRLFQRGFSTRAHKSGGLGLHWCANAMNAMGGTLALESEGQGRGASAVLTVDAAQLSQDELAA
ncbi:sensor histidine kinase [Sphingomonas baiyangensis]|uniref:histidine kinase n=1 Tax=Sphingomonas baiyangensis TaxID=2572576 RepID=A0A4U1L4H4_9SPHN|nr:CHASE4 domain-containing protein [Sphingomonas baiyangensis]TKD51085.1 HAMP domain-containing protein [Sphingomonas baiyangensis]